MDFQQRLQQELKSMEQNNNRNFGDKDIVYPTSKLKNDMLYFNKDNTQFMVRVLPPVNDETFFAAPFKEIWLNKTNKNGKDLNFQATLPFYPSENSSLTKAIAQWQQEERVPNNFNRKASPSKRFFVNAVQVAMDNNGNMQMERDQNGQMVVRVLKLPQTAYQALLSKISDPMLTPQNSGDYGLIGDTNAFPVRITKPAPGGMSYTIDVFQRDLGALDSNWRELAEDLAYQATPSEEYNGDFVQYFIDVVNGQEGKNNDDGGNQGGQGAFQQPTTYQQAPQQPQQPSFNQEPPQQAQPSFNQGGFQPQSQQQGFNQPPVQQAPQQSQPSFNQAPVDTGDANPYNNGGGQGAFDANMPTNFQAMPEVAPQQEAQPAPQTGGFQQAPQQEQPAAPAQNPTPTNNTQAANVDDILAQMQSKLDQ